MIPELVVRNDEGQPETVKYHLLPTLLLNELQKQQRTIGAQQEIMEMLEARLAALERLLLPRVDTVR